MWQQRISTKKCCPCTVNIACHVKQSITGWRSSRKGGQVSKTNIESVGRWRSPRRQCCSASKKIIRADRRVTNDAVATAIGCSHGQAYNMMHERLGVHKVCSRWVPRQLIPQHKSQRMGLSLQHLQHYQDEGDDMLSRIVTGDESWVHHYGPETKRASMQWKIPLPQRTRRLR